MAPDSTKNFLVSRLSNVIQSLQNVTKRYVLFATEGNKENTAKVAKEVRVARDENGKFCFAPEERRTTKKKATQPQQKSTGELLVKNAEATGEEDLQAWETGGQLQELQTAMYLAVD